MKLARLANEPSALIDFFQSGLESLGAVCERTWHDRLQLVAEGPAARLWNPQGALVEAEIHFIPPGDTAPRQADKEVFPGCPLTFRLADELRPSPLPLERAVLQPLETPKAPAVEVAERLWLAQMPGTSRWKMTGVPIASWHFSLLALARCEIQAIDQHWTLHRIALSLPNGDLDPSLAQSLDFAQLSDRMPDIAWPSPDLPQLQAWLTRAVQQESDLELLGIRERQQRYLRRELERVDTYFDAYEKELTQRQRRAHAESSKIKTEERLAAAKSEHARRREDQIRRHEIRVIVHLDALILFAEPAWETHVSFLEKGQPKVVPAHFVPRSRRWVVTDSAIL